ncbi:hypothetical protein [Brochothrix campestris]|uniref:Uncharacterized protein n=1 Tax=Brochothrix campestris FSL F6-1037 TaxID=1265861 RepID=W7CFN2_9LIST|nr:hypothetical protein [Brochothrix campestris]EUJ34676.1 hypothetical protein BCAMP_12135 [Brochothrix campestris FSL F6-1037]
MKIKIGDKNKIKDSIIGKQNIVGNEAKNNEGFFHKHPVLTALLTSFVIGFLLLFSFWDDVINFIENIF